MTTITFFSVSTVGYFGYRSASKAYYENMTISNKEKIFDIADDIDHFLSRIPKDLRFLTDNHALNRYIQWDEIGEDHKAGQWYRRTITTFSSFIKARKIYKRLQFFSADSSEHIRINYDNSAEQALISPRALLRDKNETPFIEAAFGSGKEKVTSSDILLHEEEGVIQKPYTPVIHYASPVIDRNNINKGVIVLTVYAEGFLKLIEREDTMDTYNETVRRHIHLIDKEGFYLAHHDSKKLFGEQSRHDMNLKQDSPALYEAITSSTDDMVSVDGVISSFKRIYPHDDSKDIYWFLYSETDESEALVKLRGLTLIFLIILLSVLTFIFFVTRRFFRQIVPPLLFVTDKLKKLSQGEIDGETIVYKADDEISDMLTSYYQLQQNITLTIKHAHTIASGDYTSNIRPLSEKDELGTALLNMTETLRQLSDIAQLVAQGDYSIEILVKSDKDFLGKSINLMIDNLQKITEIAKAIALGDFSKQIVTRGEKDVLGNSINLMISTLRDVVDQANHIATGDYTIRIEPKSDKDELAITLRAMTEKLIEGRQFNKEQTWLKDGINELKNNLTGAFDKDEIARRALAFISEYTNSAVGALYLYEKNEELLRQHASYAFVERKALSDTFKLGEGVVGQVALQRTPILLKNIKRDHLVISTGTTNEPPLNTYTYPLLDKDELTGVIELGSHEEFGELKQDFLNTSVGVVTTSISLAIQSAKVRELLEASQRANEELQVRGEELESANTELEEQREQLEIQTLELKEKNEKLLMTREELNKRAKEVEIASKYKSEFMANMSHELRTPLNSIILISKIMSDNKNGKFSDDDVKKLKVVHSSGEELLRLINDLLDLSKIESGKMTLNIEKIHTSELTDSLFGFFEQTAREKGLKFEIVDRLKGTIETDSEKLSQILRNLLSNAFKFTNKGSVDLILDKNDDPAMPVKITVKDTGIGIPEEKQTIIFNAFQQLDGSISRQYGGTGLGLSISRSLISLLKGRIELKSETGAGSEFSVYIPLAVTDSDDSVEREREYAKSNDSIINPVNDDREDLPGSDKAILIIDDDRGFCEFIKEYVHKIDFKVLIALTGEEGIALARRYIPAGIILDLGLPDMSGIDLLRELKSQPLTANIPVHIVSARDYDPLFKDLGALGFTQKPVVYETIEKIIDNISGLTDTRGQCILVVEDDEVQREHILEMVRKKSIETRGVSSTKEAIEEIRNGCYGTVIVDLHLKESNGLQLCRYIKENSPNVPVIIYTARELPEEEEAELKKLADSIIAKTVTSDRRLSEELDIFLHRVSNNDYQSAPACVSESGKAFSNKKLLIVDDDPKNIFVISSALEDEGAATLHALNGKKALDILKSNKDIDLILMDIMMPVMDGYETIGHIRRDKQYDHIPIIALTAKAMKEDKQKCIAAGADDYIMKPVNYDILVRIIKAWLGKGEGDS